MTPDRLARAVELAELLNNSAACAASNVKSLSRAVEDCDADAEREVLETLHACASNLTHHSRELRVLVDAEGWKRRAKEVA
jgi:cell division ATPase FtsA